MASKASISEEVKSMPTMSSELRGFISSGPGDGFSCRHSIQDQDYWSRTSTNHLIIPPFPVTNRRPVGLWAFGIVPILQAECDGISQTLCGFNVHSA